MESDNQPFSYVQELHKNRSYASCISTAYHDVTSHFKSLFHELWKYALVYALIVGLGITIQFSADLKTSLWGDLFSLAWSVPMCIASIVICGKILSLINTRDVKHNSLRFFTSYLVIYIAIMAFFIVTIVASVLLFADQNNAQSLVTTLGITFAIDVVVILLLCTPQAYSWMKFLMEENQGIGSIFGSNWKVGFRHFGFIFATMFLLTLIACVLWMVLFVPLIILLAAYGANSAGAAAGDPSTLSASLLLPTYLYTSAILFVASYFLVWVFFVYYYIYGTIETRENERSEAEILVH